MRKSVEGVVPIVENRAIAELESRPDAAIIPPTQKKRSTQRFHVASWSGEVCPGTCEAGMPNTSLDRPPRIKSRSPQELLNQ